MPVAFSPTGFREEPKIIRRKAVPAKEFIDAWHSSDSVDEVAKKLKMEKPSVYARKSQMLRRGVKLKEISQKKSHRKLDINDLNAYIAKLDVEKNKKNGSSGN